MGRRRKRRRRRVGRVSYYLHHGAWFIYYREGDRQIRRRVADTEEAAEQIAAQTNAQLTGGGPTAFTFEPIAVAELRRRSLEHHELVLGSSLATVRRYAAASQHLEDFVPRNGNSLAAHKLSVDAFVRYLRTLKVAPVSLVASCRASEISSTSGNRVVPVAAAFSRRSFCPTANGCRS